VCVWGGGQIVLPLVERFTRYAIFLNFPCSVRRHRLAAWAWLTFVTQGPLPKPTVLRPSIVALRSPLDDEPIPGEDLFSWPH
jgi:hypothetical protein